MKNEPTPKQLNLLNYLIGHRRSVMPKRHAKQSFISMESKGLVVGYLNVHNNMCLAVHDVQQGTRTYTRVYKITDAGRKAVQDAKRKARA